MERIKVDLLITGDLQCKQKLMGGGNFYLLGKERERIDEWFDTSSAVVIDGDVLVDSFDSRERCVVVCGSAGVGNPVQEGGGDGQH